MHNPTTWNGVIIHATQPPLVVIPILKLWKKQICCEFVNGVAFHDFWIGMLVIISTNVNLEMCCVPHSMNVCKSCQTLEKLPKWVEISHKVGVII